MRQLNLEGEPGWSEAPKETSDPVIVEFSMQGLLVSVQADRLKRSKAIAMFQCWFPDAEVIPDPLASGEEAPRNTA